MIANLIPNAAVPNVWQCIPEKLLQEKGFSFDAEQNIITVNYDAASFDGGDGSLRLYASGKNFIFGPQIISRIVDQTNGHVIQESPFWCRKCKAITVQKTQRFGMYFQYTCSCGHRHSH